MTWLKIEKSCEITVSPRTKHPQTWASHSLPGRPFHHPTALANHTIRPVPPWAGPFAHLPLPQGNPQANPQPLRSRLCPPPRTTPTTIAAPPDPSCPTSSPRAARPATRHRTPSTRAWRSTRTRRTPRSPPWGSSTPPTARSPAPTSSTTAAPPGRSTSTDSTAPRSGCRDCSTATRTAGAPSRFPSLTPSSNSSAAGASSSGSGSSASTGRWPFSWRLFTVLYRDWLTGRNSRPRSRSFWFVILYGCFRGFTSSEHLTSCIKRSIS